MESDEAFMAAASILSGVANTIYEGAKDILAHSHTPAEIAAGIARLLNKFITWPYVVGQVSIRELEGTGNSNFPAVIYTRLGGATRRAARPEKTDGSARSSWGLAPRKRRSHQGL
jgi:hypothetical protein